MLTNKQLQEQNLILKRQINTLAKEIDKIKYTAETAEIKVDRVLGLYAIALNICKQNKSCDIDRTKEDITIQLIKENKPYDSYIAPGIKEETGEEDE